MLLGVVAQGAVAPAWGTHEVITFEEDIPSPGNVRLQYCLSGALNRGVVLFGGRAIEPEGAPTPHSGARVLTTHRPSDEDAIFGGLLVRFTELQDHVGAYVGLNQTYSVPATVYLRAYTSEAPDDASLVTETSVVLGPGPMPTMVFLEVQHPPGIRSVVFETLLPGGEPAYEVIDDLSFQRLGGACGTDTTAPSSFVTRPLPGADLYPPNLYQLGLRVRDPFVGDPPFASGIASVEVQYRRVSDGSSLGCFIVCGGFECGNSGRSCGTTSMLGGIELERTAFSHLPADADGAVLIEVRAQDFAGNVGVSAPRQVVVHRPSPDLNLWVAGVELTQGTTAFSVDRFDARRSSAPDPDLLVPGEDGGSAFLVAGRTTLLRAYIGLEGNTGSLRCVGGFLRCFTDEFFTIECPEGGFLRPAAYFRLNPLEPRHDCADFTDRQLLVAPFAGNLDEERNDAVRSLNFELPDAWTTPGERWFQLVIDGGYTPECAGCEDTANRVLIGPVEFNRMPKFGEAVKLVLVDWHPPLPAGMLPPRTVDEARPLVDDKEDELRKLWPFDEEAYPLPETLETLRSEAPREPSCQPIVYDLLAAFRELEDKQRVVGLGPPPSNLPDTYNYCSGGVAIGWAGTCRVGSGTALACVHEPTHTFGIKHHGDLDAVDPPHSTECKESSGGCEDFPYDHASIGVPGYDILRHCVIPLEDRGDDSCVTFQDTEHHAHDYMSYAGPGWTSDYTWNRVAQAVRDLVGSGSLADPEALLVSGQVDALGVALDPLYTMPVAATLSAPGVGPHRLVLRDAADNVLFERAFELTVSHVEDENFPDGQLFYSFSELVPAFDELDRVEVVIDGGPTATVQRSPNAPGLSVTAPAAGAVWVQGTQELVAWTGQDTDGDVLRYLVQYSHDAGASWRTVGVNLTTASLDVAVDHVAGGAEAFVRVFASDGLNTARAVAGPFTVATKPPAARIDQPASGATFLQGDLVVFHGRASDIEDGALPPEAFTWTSSLDGPIGNGRRVQTSGLSPGVHTITLTATDSTSQSAAAEVQVIIEGRPGRVPVAVAAPASASVALGEIVTLDGTASFDADGDALDHYWTVVERPAGSFAFPADPDVAVTTFAPDVVGEYLLHLVVHDGSSGSAPALVRLAVALDRPVLRHYQCYEVRPPHVFSFPDVSLVDAIWSTIVSLTQTPTLCAPADKNEEDPGAVSEVVHMASYQMRAAPFARVSGLGVTNQFGTLSLDLVRPARLLVPSSKSLAGPPPPLADAVDHFACYKAKRSKGTPRFQRQLGVTVETQFGGSAVDVLKPIRLCLPADVNAVTPGAEAHTQYLVCYRVRGGGGLPNTLVHLNNQFGQQQYVISKRRELCVPSVSPPPPG